MELLPFQRQVVEETLTRFGGSALLALEMGCGKTPISIEITKSLVYKKAVRIQHPSVLTCPFRALVICPASLRLNWIKEVRSWWPEMRTVIIDGQRSVIPYTREIVICSYEYAAKHSVELTAQKFDVCLADESTYIKNPKAKRTQAIIPIFQAAKYKLLLTGTPILNRPIELYSQLSALGVSYGTYWQFAKKYCNAHQTRFGWDVSGASNIAELNYKLKTTCMIRRLKAEVLSELPEKNRCRISIGGLGRCPKGKALENVALKALKWANWNISLALDKLRGKEYNFSQCFFEAYSELGEAKSQAAGDIVAQFADNDQIVCFAHHKIVIKSIAAWLDKSKLSFGVITGDTPMAERQKTVEAFQAGKLRVVVCSITAASTGITLTAASNMIIAELPLTPGMALQAEDRIHRIGQKNAATIRYLCADNTLDDSLWRMITNKSQVSNSVIDGVNGSTFDDVGISETNGYWGMVEDLLKRLVDEHAQTIIDVSVNQSLSF